ncbi:hypothetical protein ColLi_06883 [Colletotrichum liriopes]|uniref:Uncharacterized protein n=1 Tax=Colletotrichum liriopes TaxID=708192 RepID=A0AA37GNS4_9PEZI|nr:hypothetical protein ColLi_06883 [Colletotrichum liriopes]
MFNPCRPILVPYDDPKSNPFRTVLPQMAVRNDHLLSLLLAYSGKSVYTTSVFLLSDSLPQLLIEQGSWAKKSRR